MTTHLTERQQLAWLRSHSPGFARAEEAVLRRDADVAKNNARFAKHAEPENVLTFMKRAGCE